jgi:serine/threonine-protein kinase
MRLRIAASALAAALVPAGCGGAGGGSATVGPGPGGDAVTATFAAPEALAVDAAGNLYVSELEGNRVDRIAPDGTFAVVAGTGAAGFAGDGGPAVRAELNAPAGLAIDDRGRLLVADRHNDRIRVIDAGGAIRTVFRGSGTHLDDPVGIALAADGTLVVADELNARVVRLDEAGVLHRVAGGRAARSALSRPWYVVVDRDGSVVFSDVGASRIRRVDEGGTLTNVAGTGEAGFSGDGGEAAAAELDYPTGLALGPDGGLYVSDTNNSCVRRIDPNGTITTVAGFGTQGFSGDGGPATAAEHDSPEGLAIDEAGNLYIADQRNNRIRRVDTNGVIDTVAGSG